MALFYFRKSRLFLPRVIGSFLLVLAMVMFVVTAGDMFDSWDAMSKYPDCLARIGSETDNVAMMKYLDCKDSLYNITGMQLRPDQQKITSRQFAIALLRPIGGLLAWAIVFLLGLFFYHTKIVRPEPTPLERPVQKKRKRK